MAFKIKNWKLAFLALLFICFFASLGNWQLSRAQQKRILLASYAKRTAEEPLKANDLNGSPLHDLRFYQATLEGSFDNAHTLLLDNKIVQGRVGYEVYTPFNAKGFAMPILVDRGFIPIGANRKDLPAIRPVLGNTSITGMLNLPPTYVAFGQISESSKISWPLRIEFINLSTLSALLGYQPYAYIVSLPAHDPAAYAVEWQIVTMSPERHTGYAVQWFALALTLLILFVALNREPAKKDGRIINKKMD